MFGGLMGALMGRKLRKDPATEMAPSMPQEAAGMEPMQKSLPGGMTMDQLGPMPQKTMPGGTGTPMGVMGAAIGRGFGSQGTPGNIIGRMMGGMRGAMPAPPPFMNAPPVSGGFGAPSYGGGLGRVDSALQIPENGTYDPSRGSEPGGFAGGINRPRLLPNGGYTDTKKSQEPGTNWSEY